MKLLIPIGLAFTLALPLGVAGSIGLNSVVGLPDRSAGHEAYVFLSSAPWVSRSEEHGGRPVPKVEQTDRAVGRHADEPATHLRARRRDLSGPTDCNEANVAGVDRSRPFAVRPLQGAAQA